MTRIPVALRVVAGIAVVAAGVWLFVQGLPTPNFLVLVLSLIVGIFIIEAPRMLKASRQRQERIAAYIDENAAAEEVMNRANNLQRWSWICYGLGIAIMFVGGKLFGPEGLFVTLAIALALMAVGFGLGLYQVFARTSVDFRSLSAAKPATSQRTMWIITGGLFGVIIVAVVAEKIWHIPTMSWLYGALAIFLVGAFVWRWLRGWSDDSDS